MVYGTYAHCVTDRLVRVVLVQLCMISQTWVMVSLFVCPLLLFVDGLFAVGGAIARVHFVHSYTRTFCLQPYRCVVFVFLFFCWGVWLGIQVLALYAGFWSTISLMCPSSRMWIHDIDPGKKVCILSVDWWWTGVVGRCNWFVHWTIPRHM